MDDTNYDLAVLRREAEDELAAVIELRCRLGDDPWDFVPDLPSVDEQVVAGLREQIIQDRELSMARARAHHPAAGSAARAEEFDFRILREIALDHPELTVAVWSVLSRLPRAS